MHTNLKHPGRLAHKPRTSHQAFHHDLSSSALTLLTVGGVMGSGLFMASGLAIQHAGPIILPLFALGWLLMTIEINALAEMSIATPTPGSFIVFTREVLGPGWTFVSGWVFWFSSVLTMSSEVTAAALFSRYWFPGMALWIWSLLYSALIIGLNFISVRGFGEVESFMAGTKILAVLGFIATGLLILLHALPARHPLPSLSGMLGQNGGWFPHGWSGALPAMILVLFAYAGTGVIGLAAAESKNPHRTVKRAVSNTVLLILFLYLGSIFIILALTPWHQQSDRISPFVLALHTSTLPDVSLVMNVVLLLAVLSTMNAALYSNVRVLYSLSQQKQAPRWLGRLNSRGLPTHAIWASAALLGLTIILAYVLPKKAYSYLVTATGFQAMFIWLMVLLTQRFYRPYLERRHPEKLMHKLWGFPYTTYFAMALVLAAMAVSPLAKGELPGALVGVGGIAVAFAAWLLMRDRIATDANNSQEKS